jgi:hypothetical protein
VFVEARVGDFVWGSQSLASEWRNWVEVAAVRVLDEQVANLWGQTQLSESLQIRHQEYSNLQETSYFTLQLQTENTVIENSIYEESKLTRVVIVAAFYLILHSFVGFFFARFAEVQIAQSLFRRVLKIDAMVRKGQPVQLRSLKTAKGLGDL